MSDRILIVDDNADNLRLMVYLLRRHGHDVGTACDADTAIEAVHACRPHLILMDIQLPGIDGLELTSRFKADPETSDIVIVAVTAYALKTDERRALAAGCDGYLAKPINTRTLPAVVARFLAQAMAP